MALQPFLGLALTKVTTTPTIMKYNSKVMTTLKLESTKAAVASLEEDGYCPDFLLLMLCHVCMMKIITRSFYRELVSP